jgi:hypothetical protein
MAKMNYGKWRKLSKGWVPIKDEDNRLGLAARWLLKKGPTEKKVAKAVRRKRRMERYLDAQIPCERLEAVLTCLLP